MRNPKRLSREEIKKIIVDTLIPLGVLRIGIFGSFSRHNDTHAESDIDILVTLRDTESRQPIGMRWFVLDQELERALGIPVDLVSEDALNPHLRSVIQKELEIIYDEIHSTPPFFCRCPQHHSSPCA